VSGGWGAGGKVSLSQSIVDSIAMP